MAEQYCKPAHARCMLRSNPLDWFRQAPIAQRDLDLLAAEPVPFVKYDNSSYLRKIYHMKAGEKFEQTNWSVENDEACKELVRSARGQLYGYDNATSPPIHWASMAVNVNISGTPGAGFDWGFLTTRPHDIRIFKGPSYTCSLHPWDAIDTAQLHTQYRRTVRN